MSNYGQYCPMAKALEILGDRWTMLIIRDMLTGTMHFNDFERGLPGISRGLLAKRLRQLQDAGVIEKVLNTAGRKTTEYRLTQAGCELYPVINALLSWGAAWAFADPVPEDLDPLLLMWWMRNRVNRDHLPMERVVIQFDFSGERTGTYWLILTAEDISVCLTNPGYEIDILVMANLAEFFKLWLGRITYREAIQSDHLRIEGIPGLVRAFPKWFAWSPASSIVRSTAAKKRASE